MLAHLNVEKSALSHIHKLLRSEHSNHFKLFHVTQGGGAAQKRETLQNKTRL